MAVPPESHVSLFSGIGALDFAIGSVFPGNRCLAYVEGEAYAAAVLAARMASGDLDDAVVWSDVRTFPTGGLRGRVDMVAGGFPCQDLSLAGKRAGIGGERSGLFFDLIRVVRDVRPRYVFLENVAAIATGRALDTVLGALAESGLDAEWGCLRASDVGAPHRRDRWWCLAWDRELVNTPSIGRTEQPLIDDARWSLGCSQSGADGRALNGHAAPGVSVGRRTDATSATDLGRQLADTPGGRWGPTERETDAGQPDASGGRPAVADTQQHDVLGRRAIADAADGQSGPQAGTESVRGSSTMAVATRLQRTGQGRGLWDGGRVREVRQIVGDPGEWTAERRRGSGDMAGTAVCPEREGDQRERRGCAAGDSGAGMADSGRGSGELANRHATLGRRTRDAEQTGVGSGGLGWPGFPPGPDDRDGWRAFLEQHPDLAPATQRAIRRVADGPAVRVDRLRALGNAVVPQQAAAALRILWYRAFGAYP